MIDDVYNAKILELAAAVPDPERLADPDGSATKHSKLCGSQLRADIGLSGDAIDRVAMEVKACALGQAAAAVVHAHAPGATLDEVVAAREAMRAMLKEGGEPPAGRFADLRYLEPVRDYRARHASTLLAIEALAEAFENAAGAALRTSGRTSESAAA